MGLSQLLNILGDLPPSSGVLCYCDGAAVQETFAVAGVADEPDYCCFYGIFLCVFEDHLMI